MYSNIIATLALLLSMLALLVSAIMAYLIDLRQTRVDVYLGELLRLHHPNDGGAAFYLPVTFSNRGARTRIVRSCTLELIRAQDGIRYEMLWRYFYRFAPSRSLEIVSAAHPIAIGPRSSEHRIVWFTWRPYAKPPLEFSPGRYSVGLIARCDKYSDVRFDGSFLIDEGDAQRIRKLSQDKDNPLTEVLLEGQFMNRAMRGSSMLGQFGPYHSSNSN